MSNNNHRKYLRKQRQEARAKELFYEGHDSRWDLTLGDAFVKANGEACRRYIIFGGDLLAIMREVGMPVQKSRRLLRTERHDRARAEKNAAAYQRIMHERKMAAHRAEERREANKLRGVTSADHSQMKRQFS